jgi:hypothetical protein
LERKNIPITKIISGGQTGADRAALDFAIGHGIPHGGCVPKGRRTEEGTLPEKYKLQEMPTVSYPERTAQNVLDADGTLIISHGLLSGGSALTRRLAARHGKPCLHIDLKKTLPDEAALRVLEWIRDNAIKVLNVAGPRASEDMGIYGASLALLEKTFLHMPAKNP